MTTVAGLPELVAKAFEAGCEVDGMQEFLADTAHFFNAQLGAILISQPDNPADITSITVGIAPDRIQEWCATHGGPDSIFGEFTQLRPGEAVATNSQNPNHWSMRLLGGVVFGDEKNRCYLALWRDAGQPPFSGPELETLRVLIGYFRRAIDASIKLGAIVAEHQSALLILDQAPRAIIILGQNNQPLYQNLEAIRILNKNDGMKIDQSKVTIDDDNTGRKVSTFLEQINSTKSRPFNAHRMATVVPRKAEAAPYKLIVQTLPLENLPPMLNGSYGIAVMLIYDPEILITLNTSLLHNFYNLTRAEAALSQSLFIGNSLPEASDHLGISINTTRTQLRSIFRKVGVHSQAALLQEFATSVGPG